MVMEEGGGERFKNPTFKIYIKKGLNLYIFFLVRSLWLFKCSVNPSYGNCISCISSTMFSRIQWTNTWDVCDEDGFWFSSCKLFLILYWNPLLLMTPKKKFYFLKTLTQNYSSFFYLDRILANESLMRFIRFILVSNITFYKITLKKNRT